MSLSSFSISFSSNSFFLFFPSIFPHFLSKYNLTSKGVPFITFLLVLPFSLCIFVSLIIYVLYSNFVPTEGLKPSTFSLGQNYSIQLSYAGICWKDGTRTHNLSFNGALLYTVELPSNIFVTPMSFELMTPWVKARCSTN